MNDPWESRNIEKLIRHELVHAKQYETVARSKDGIKKINYSALYQVAKNAKRIPLIENEFKNIYYDIKTSGDKYNNVKIRIGGADVNFQKFIEGVNIICGIRRKVSPLRLGVNATVRDEYSINTVCQCLLQQV